MRFRLDPANLHENGKTPVFVPFVTGGSGEGYWDVGNWARYVFTTSAHSGRVRMFSNESAWGSALPATNTLIPYRVNGENRDAGIAFLGDAWYDLHFGLFPGINTTNKRVELFVPIQNATLFGGAPTGVYPIEIEFDGQATIVAPATTGPHWVMLGDSIAASGMFARTGLDSMMGLAKLGSSDPYHRMYAGNYNAGTGYLPAQTGSDVGQIVAYTDGFTYEKISNAPAGTTPTPGADWKRRGFSGRVTIIGWGARRWIDDINNTTNINALVAKLVSLNPTRIGAIRGVNDHAANVAVATMQTQITAFMNALGASSVGGVPCTLYGTTLAPSYEGTNSLGETLDQMRSAISAGLSASSHPNKAYVDLKPLITSAETVDQLHPGTVGHYKTYIGL